MPESAREAAGTGLQAVSESAFLISVAIVFPLGALVLNRALWRSWLVPRFISGWGLVGAAFLLIGSLLLFFEVLLMASGGVESVLTGPIAVQEMALALWLITKGFTGTERGVA